MNIDLSKSEEDYLKALFHLCMESPDGKAGTNQIATYLNLAPASVSGMLKKLRKKGLVDYEKYGKLELTAEGRSIALHLIRKHRLWETFLYEKMNFTWDEVHEVAEQLEHIKSQKLISELDAFLGFPKTDPHGDVIPDRDGNYMAKPKQTLAEIEAGYRCRIVSVRDSSVAFLQYVTSLGIELSNEIEVLETHEYDGSMRIVLEGRELSVSHKFADNLYVSSIRKK